VATESFFRATEQQYRGKTTRDDITVFEARNVRGYFGEISKCDRLYQQNPEGARLPPSIIVELSKFSDNKLDIEAVSIFVRNPRYVTNTNNLFLQMSARNPGYKIERFDATKKAAVGASADKEFLKKYDINRRSVYVSGRVVEVQ